MMSAEITINKDNINTILNEFAKQYKKCCGSLPAEIIIVGGGSIVINYGFRQMTQDLDVILKTSSGVKDAICNTSEKLGLPNDWMNSDFQFLPSYSVKLEEVSKHYRTMNNGTLEIRTVKSEYLIAMKMQSGREFGNDISDIIGIIKSEKEQGNNITYETIISAGYYLYNDNFNISDNLKKRVEKYCSLTEKDLEKEYQKSISISQKVKLEVTKREPELLNKTTVKQLAQQIELELEERE